MSQEKKIVKKTRKVSSKWLGVLVIAVLLFAFFVEGKAIVTIYPKTNEISGEEIVKVVLKQGTLDEEKNARIQVDSVIDIELRGGLLRSI